MFLMSRLASCRSAGFLLLSRSANLCGVRRVNMCHETAHTGPFKIPPLCIVKSNGCIVLSVQTCKACRGSREASVYLHTADCQVHTTVICSIWQHHTHKIVTFTLLFFSSSNTGLTGRGEDDGIKVASRGISGSANTTPKLKQQKETML